MGLAVFIFNLTNENLRFKNGLKTLGDLYDYDFPSELTENKKNFKDPFHFNQEVSKIIICEFVNGKSKYARYIKRKTSK